MIDRSVDQARPPMVAYRFEDSRSGGCVALHLDGFRGILQVDGYAAYNRLGKDRGANDAMTLAGCWAHARRKFFDLHPSDGSPFTSAVSLFSLVSSGLGVGFVPEWMKELPNRNVAFRPVEGVDFNIGLSIAWSKDDPTANRDEIIEMARSLR